MPSETTPLVGEPVNPKFGFIMRRRTRQFQCCVGALLLAFIISLVVVTISFLNIQEMNEIDAAIQNGTEALQERDEIESNIPVLQLNSPSYRHQMSTATSPKADQISRHGYAKYYASKWLKNKRKDKLPCYEEALRKAGWCALRKTNNCTQSRYRTINGSCNNLNHPNSWGVAFTEFRRMMPPEYNDGIGEPRGGSKLPALPAASTVSDVVHRPTYKDDPNFTVMLAVWGQFMDHDVTATALSRKKTGEAISCCNISFRQHPECFPVLENGQCTDFVRSAPAGSCCMGTREQLNQVSSYLDGSVVYGSDYELMDRLRTFRNGSLEMLTTLTGRQLLPVSRNLKDGCNRLDMSNKDRYCFISGDARANENLHLTTMHLLWARQHNRIANILQELNPNWDDETIYQESRHIVAGQIQHITYKEFLPIVLGFNVIQKFDLFPYNEGYYYGYNSSVDVTIANEFAAAAFRFAHTLIPGLIRQIGNNTGSRLHEMLFNPFRLYDNELDDVIKEALQTPIEASDPYFVDELKHHLFERKTENKTPKPCGLDLVALNIQRGRDHGLPGYTKWRTYCNLSTPKTFQDMVGYIDKDSLDSISKLYAKVEDIDPYTGALSERPIVGSLVGPTASCIIRDQFVRLKDGDRYWYETPEQPQAFTPDQLREVRKTTLASIICQNGDDIKEVPQWVMRQANTTSNPIVSCDGLDSLNASYWKQS